MSFGENVNLGFCKFWGNMKWGNVIFLRKCEFWRKCELWGKCELFFFYSLKTPDDQWLYCEVRGCSFWTRKAERMDRHRQCHRPDAKYYKCPDCSLRFYSLAKMLKHDRKVHTGVKDYECRVCEAEVTDIQIHMRVSESKFWKK